MFTTKAVAYFTVAIILLSLALLFEDWQLAILVLPMASIFFLTNALGFPEKVDIEIEQDVTPNESFGDGPVQVSVTVRNRGDSVLENVEILEPLPEAIVLEKGTNYLKTALGPGDAFKLSMEFPSPERGHYEIGPLTVTVRDVFGLYLTERKLDSETLAIMPRPERIRGAELRPRQIGPWGGIIPSRNGGMGTEFHSLRGYIPGDDLKRVNWKASAHANKLIVNEMEAERVTDVMVVLDTDVTLYEDSEGKLFEQSVQAAASMSSLLLHQGNRVGLILQGEERGIVKPGFGKRHERRILYTLATAKPGRAVISTSYVMTLLARLMLPARAQIVIISPLVESGLIEGISQLAIAGYSVLVLSPFARQPERFGSESERLAFGLTRLEHTNLLMAVERISTLIRWPEGVPLSRMLREARLLRPRALT